MWGTSHPQCRDACNASASCRGNILIRHKSGTCEPSTRGLTAHPAHEGTMRTQQDLGEVPLHRICLHLSLSEEPRDVVLRIAQTPALKHMRHGVLARHDARLGQTFDAAGHTRQETQGSDTAGDADEMRHGRTHKRLFQTCAMGKAHGAYV